MGDKTGIEWTDSTWNPTTGCDKVSPGCDNCYALTQAKRLKAMGQPNYQRDGNPATSGPGFGFTEHPGMLDRPLRWQRPRRIFVNSMSDLFHESVTREHVADVFAIMALAHQHTFQVLTKRPAKARSWLSDPTFQSRMRDRAYLMTIGEHPAGIKVPKALIMAYGTVRTASAETRPWPLPNVWMGTSVEDQKRADLRIPALLGTPAARRFLSMEPLLGPVDLTEHLHADDEYVDVDGFDRRALARPGVDWIIVGGESGPGARPMHRGWVRDLRDQCVDAGVPFLFKQWGSWAPVDGFPEHGDRWVLGGGLASIEVRGGEELSSEQTTPWAPGTLGAPPGKWDPYGDVLMRPMDKHDAGRTLDGRTWDEYPDEETL